jgi:hypothetical protein
MTTSEAMLRQERLAGRVQGLRGRGGLLHLSDRWMLVIGGTLVPLGVVLVLLGWWGASHTVLLFEQVPYLISGGLLGLALVFGGGFTYFAYWLTLLVRENRAERDQLTAVLLRMENLMQDAAQPRTHRTASGAYTGGFVATRTGTMLHRPDCVAVDGRDNLREVTADTPGLTPCRLCDPLDEG